MPNNKHRPGSANTPRIQILKTRAVDAEKKKSVPAETEPRDETQDAIMEAAVRAAVIAAREAAEKATREAAEKAAREEEERLAREAVERAIREEEERVAREAAERAAREEEERLAREAAEKAAREEEERLAREAAEKAAREEEERLAREAAEKAAREEEERLAREAAEKAAREEEERLAREAAEKAESEEESEDAGDEQDKVLAAAIENARAVIGETAEETSAENDGVVDELPTVDQLREVRDHAMSAKDSGIALTMPSEESINEEKKRLTYRKRFFKTVLRIISVMLNVAAVAVLVAVLLLPVLRIYGSSMTPTLSESDLVLSIKGSKFETGDVIAFYYNNKVLVKRVIAQSGDWISIDLDGTVAVNGTVIDEPYVSEKALGECDLEFPFQVPEGRVFVMGDHRATSVDSRSSVIGCVAEEQIVGKIVFRLWPMQEIGTVD